jgi:hypothetical protein
MRGRVAPPPPRGRTRPVPAAAVKERVRVLPEERHQPAAVLVQHLQRRFGRAAVLLNLAPRAEKSRVAYIGLA